jgi:anti-anti-sigma factor
MQGIGAVAEDRAALQLAVAEVLLNSIEHAYPTGAAGVIGMDVALRDSGYVECRIADHGTWQTPSTSASGHGLALVEQLIDDVLVSHPPQVSSVPRGARGTMVTLRHKFRRPAMLAADVSARHREHERDRPFGVEAGLTPSGAVALVSGQIDVFTAEEFSRELLTLSGGGTLAITVDLTGVTQLASAGVSALFRIRQQLTAQLQDLTLIAADGSTVAAVLEIVGLPYRASPEPGR